MPTLAISNFGGIVPRIHPTLLPTNCATVAHNCKLKNGKLVPLREPIKVNDKYIRLVGLVDFDISDAKTAYVWHRFGITEYLLFEGVVNITQTNFGSDTKSRIFVSGETGYGTDLKSPIVIWEDFGDVKIQLLSKEDPPAPEVRRLTNLPSGEENIRYTYFFQTWVDALGYESGCSKPSNEIKYIDGDSMYIQPWENPPSEAAYRRIYKVVTGMETNNIQFIIEQKKNNDKFYRLSFKIKDEDAGEVMPMITPVPEFLQQMSFVPGGFYVGYDSENKRTIRFSEIGNPTSFPEEYAYEVNEDIVGIAVTQNNVWALTTGHPYVLSGSTPDAMGVTKISAMQGSIAPRGICVVDGSVFYISYDGICMLTEGSGSVNVVTDDYFTKEQWNNIVDKETIMCGYDSALFVWTNKVDGIGGYRIEFLEKLSAITTFDNKAQCVCVDAITDKMYFINKE